MSCGTSVKRVALFSCTILITNYISRKMASSSVSHDGVIYLRHDQHENFIGQYDENVGVYAPLWVKQGLTMLGKELNNITFNIYDLSGEQNRIGSITFNECFGLKDLQKIARNEEMNVSGEYRPFMYAPLDNKHGVIIALRDLVRQCIVVGSDETTHYGGYPHRSNSRIQQPNTRVIICDLAALQFQQFHNTGRLVLTQKYESVKGVLDEYIFENVVGERKRNYGDIVEYMKHDTTQRYEIARCFSKHNCFFDTFAYQRFVANDVVLCGLAVAHVALRNGDKVNFKFLKYGSGFFAGDLSYIINKYVLSGVVIGLEELFEKHSDIVKGNILHVELPFYEEDEESLKVLERIKLKHGLEYSFSMDDALKATKGELVTATTNCGDSAVVFGNEMNFGSVDAAIAENLKSKGNAFSSIINRSMKEYFVKKDGTIVDCDETVSSSPL